MGASDVVVETEEEPPSFAEGWRLVWKIESLRRIWYSLPFVAASLIGFVSLGALLYEEAFQLDAVDRGFVAESTAPMPVLGLIIGARLSTRLLPTRPGHVPALLANSAGGVWGWGGGLRWG